VGAIHITKSGWIEYTNRGLGRNLPAV